MKGRIKSYTPPLSDPNIAKLEKVIDSEWNPIEVAVLEHPGSRESDCYVNVDKYIACHGGRRQLGWLILKNDIAYEAMAHAVLERKENPDEFVDVTPVPGLYGTKRLLIPDDRLEWNGRPIPSYRLCHTGRDIDKDFLRLLKMLDFVQSKIVFSQDSNERLADHPLLLSIEDDLLRRHIPHLKSKMSLVNKTGRCYCNSGKQYLQCHRIEFDLMLQQVEEAIESLAKPGLE